MHIDFLVEEPSAERVLQAVLPKILEGKATHLIRVFQGKKDLLTKLPVRLKGYKRRIKNNEDLRIVVLVDQDHEDCRALKNRLERMAEEFGFITKTKAHYGEIVYVVNRIVVEEIEAWLFGDIPALRQIYPRLSPTMDRHRKYRDPDAIQGGTWEALHREIQRAGYNMPIFPKIEVASRVAKYMDPRNNRSRSFNLFKGSIEWLIGSTPI